MVEEGILIDVTHMSEHALEETLSLLDELDPGRHVPVLATHGACRLGGDHEYNLTPEQIDRVRRTGLIGLIVCKHWMAHGMAEPKTFEDSMAVICRHIDEIHRVAGSHEFVAIGSDLDGFIKPTLPGLQYPKCFGDLERFLESKYGAEDTRGMCSENAMRLLLNHWRGSTS
jgi:microsomal dipeptidase-like Zn-dependent dipeptidase